MDPGGKTGLAWGIFDETAPVSEALQSGLFKESTTILGEEHLQIEQIAKLWMSFYRDCVDVHLLDPDKVDFVSEDFVQRPGNSGGKEGQSPIRILWGVEGYRMGRAAEFAGRRKSKARVYAPHIILQHPSLGTAISSDRLRQYGCWVRGKEHERSAWKNVAVRLGVLKKVPRSGSR